MFQRKWYSGENDIHALITLSFKIKEVRLLYRMPTVSFFRTFMGHSQTLTYESKHPLWPILCVMECTDLYLVMQILYMASGQMFWIHHALFWYFLLYSLAQKCKARSFWSCYFVRKWQPRMKKRLIRLKPWMKHNTQHEFILFSLLFNLCRIQAVQPNPTPSPLLPLRSLFLPSSVRLAVMR